MPPNERPFRATVSTTRAMRRALRSCWWRIRRSVVSSNSKPASSAASNRAPLLSVSQPFDCAVWTMCADNARASPFGVPWSKRMSTGGTGSARRLWATKSRTAVTCSRVTSNCSMTSSMLRSSRFSMTVATGRRVPLNTQAPLTFPGILSTAGHWDQSSAAMNSPPSLQITANCAPVTPVHAAPRSLSICRSQEDKWFQLAKIRLTMNRSKHLRGQPPQRGW